MEEILKIEIIEIIISDLDLYLIEKVKELRQRKTSEISQGVLSRKLDLADGFVSKVENYRERSKYNIQQINKIVNIFNLASYSDLFPENILKDDMIRARIEIKKSKVFDAKSNKMRLTRSSEIISRTPLTEKEFDLWKSNKLEYLSIIK